MQEEHKTVRGDATRTRLLEEGLRLFATRGYGVVSMREIAQAAHVNHAAIGFHFKGKQGLYEAVIEYFIKELQDVCHPFISIINDTIEGCSGNIACLQEMLHSAIEQFLMVAMQKKRFPWLSILLQREYVDPTEAFEKIYNEVALPLLEAIERLTIVITGEQKDNKNIQVMVYCIMLQLTSMGRDRAIMQKRFGTETFDRKMFNMFVSVIFKEICGILDI